MSSERSGPTIEVVELERDPDDVNDVLEQVLSDFFVVVDDGTELAPRALNDIRAALSRFPDTDLLYGDLAYSDGASILQRPAFSPVRLRAGDYLFGVRAFRTSRAKDLGGIRREYAGARAFDLTLRFATGDPTVLHLAQPLGVRAEAAEVDIARRAHRSKASLAPTGAGVQAVQDHLAELGIEGTVEIQEFGGLRLHYPLGDLPLVSLIIPTRGGSATIAGKDRVLVTEAVRGIIERSTYQEIEFVVVADEDTPQSVIDDLIAIAGDRLRLVRWDAPFNFSAKINRGAACASGDYLVPLNDDVELISPDWLENMLGLAQQSKVGLVGTTLFFEDGTIQHGGHLYRGGAAGHVALGWQADWDDRLGSLGIDREVSGATAACAMVRADTFWEVGGFSTLLPGNYNDVDFSLKIRSLGLSIVCTPHAKLYHFESKSRVATIAPSELDAIRSRWRSQMELDEYWTLLL